MIGYPYIKACHKFPVTSIKAVLIKKCFFSDNCWKYVCYDLFEVCKMSN